MNEARVHIIVSGRVQGVFFRVFTERRARKLGLKGSVQNLSDGTVGIVAEGSREKLQDLVDWCHSGPPLAKVKDVQTQWEESKNEFSSFTIQR